MSKTELREGAFPLERKPYTGNLRTLSDVPVAGQNVLLRADLDVPPNSPDGQFRLAALKDTVDLLLHRDAAHIIIMGHMGRPDGFDSLLSTKQLQKPLADAIGHDVGFLDKFQQPTDRISVFENVRFFSGEQKKEAAFARKLAALGQVYVNDAFATSHREDTSMVGLPQVMRHSAAGLRTLEEVSQLEKVLSQPKERLVSLVGGAKIETKMPVIEKLAQISEIVLVGGKMPDEIDRQNIILPDNVGVGRVDASGKDIDGPSAALFAFLMLNEADTIIWNGPMGLIREKQLREGVETEVATREIAHAIAKSNAYSVVGGGDTLAYLTELGLLKYFSFVSTGGGAMLDFISGKPLPALEVLRK